MRHETRDRWLQFGFTAGLIGIAAAVGFAFHTIAAQAAWVNVAQEWEPYRLNDQQKKWFNSVRPKAPGPHCCSLADGHPTQQDHRADGFYIPNPYHPDGDWVRVPDSAFTIPGTNPIGVATVWFGTQQPDGTPFIRCFVPEAET